MTKDETIEQLDQLYDLLSPTDRTGIQAAILRAQRKVLKQQLVALKPDQATGTTAKPTPVLDSIRKRLQVQA